MEDPLQACLSFIQSLITIQASPVIIGLNGPQGVGKTTMVQSLATTLSATHGLKTLTFSIDDFYLPRTQQCALAVEHPDNQLLQHRGIPGTHDLCLLKEVLSSLRLGRECLIPVYDKGAHQGRGDRSGYRCVNRAGQDLVSVVIFEGWCVGFRAVSAAELEQTRERCPSQTLSKHKLEHLLFLNERVRDYECLVAYCDAFIYLCALDLRWVFDWREEQEQNLRRVRGSTAAMTPEQVKHFVGNYFPAYELYSHQLQEGFLDGSFEKDRQIMLVVGKNRKVLTMRKSDAT